VIAVLAAGFLAGAGLLYGRIVITGLNNNEKIKISVLQGNIDQEKKRRPQKYKKFIIQRYVDLSRKVFEDSPILIVWPEAATPGLVIKNQSLLKQIAALIREANTHFLIGSSEYSKFAKEAVDRGKIGNTALFFSPAGKVLGQYLKIQLVPFGEYLPYEDIIPWPEFIAPAGKNWDHPGKEFTLFDLDQKKFGVIICWEIVFPDLFRQFVKNGANFMINITNEGWFGDTAAPYQMVAISVFRAVENRVSLTRSANTGISCFIDPFGRITGRVQNAGKDTFIKGFLTRKIQLTRKRTFYTMHGDVFVYTCIVISFIGIATALLKSKSGSDK
jgi:apolipoprotein N-acyltransferase